MIPYQAYLSSQSWFANVYTNEYYLNIAEKSEAYSIKTQLNPRKKKNLFYYLNMDDKNQKQPNIRKNKDTVVLPHTYGWHLDV